MRRILSLAALLPILACGAVETARLLLLSKSGRFPNGLANGSDWPNCSEDSQFRSIRDRSAEDRVGASGERG